MIPRTLKSISAVTLELIPDTAEIDQVNEEIDEKYLVKSLSKYPSPKAINYFKEKLIHHDFEVREETYQALAKIGTFECFEILNQHLDIANDEDKRSVVIALSSFDIPEAYQRLNNLFQTPKSFQWIEKHFLSYLLVLKNPKEYAHCLIESLLDDDVQYNNELIVFINQPITNQIGSGLVKLLEVDNQKILEDVLILIGKSENPGFISYILPLLDRSSISKKGG